MNNTLFIMGNGPSLSEIMNDEKKLNILKNNHTFGLNSAYRVYDKYDFWPTYFGCFDYIVNKSHKDNFEKLINTKIEKLFLLGAPPDNQKLYKNIYNNDKFVKFNFLQYPIQKNRPLSKSFQHFNDMGSSGANAAQCGILMGYKKIVLLGCDCNYVEKVNGAEMVNGRLVIKETPKKNPNYWFDDYQQKGDIFNVPKAGLYQMNSWKYLSLNCPKDVDIINCSQQSLIPFFKKENFQVFL